MPALAPSAVTVNRTWTEGGTSGHVFLAKDVTLVLSGQGANTTNLIPPALFGMKSLVDCRSARTATAIGYGVSPSFTGNTIWFSGSDGVPTDVSGTYRLIVVGTR